MLRPRTKGELLFSCLTSVGVPLADPELRPDAETSQALHFLSRALAHSSFSGFSRGALTIFVTRKLFRIHSHIRTQEHPSRVPKEFSAQPRLLLPVLSKERVRRLNYLTEQAASVSRKVIPKGERG